MNFWSVENVQKCYNCVNPTLSNVKKFYAAREVLQVHYLKQFLRSSYGGVSTSF